MRTEENSKNQAVLNENDKTQRPQNTGKNTKEPQLKVPLRTWLMQ